MNTLNLTNKVIVAVAVLSLAFTANATTQPKSLKQVVTNTVATQGQQVMQQLAGQLQQNIAEQLQNFSINGAVNWLEIDADKQVATEKLIAKSNNTAEE